MLTDWNDLVASLPGWTLAEHAERRVEDAPPARCELVRADPPMCLALRREGTRVAAALATLTDAAGRTLYPSELTRHAPCGPAVSATFDGYKPAAILARDLSRRVVLPNEAASAHVHAILAQRNAEHAALVKFSAKVAAVLGIEPDRNSDPYATSFHVYRDTPEGLASARLQLTATSATFERLSLPLPLALKVIALIGAATAPTAKRKLKRDHR